MKRTLDFTIHSGHKKCISYSLLQFRLNCIISYFLPLFVLTSSDKRRSYRSVLLTNHVDVRRWWETHKGKWETVMKPTHRNKWTTIWDIEWRHFRLRNYKNLKFLTMSKGNWLWWFLSFDSLRGDLKDSRFIS